METARTILLLIIGVYAGLLIASSKYGILGRVLLLSYYIISLVGFAFLLEIILN